MQFLQVVHNACATYAIANLVGNLGTTAADPPIELGDIFRRFLDFTAPLDPLVQYSYFLNNNFLIKFIFNRIA